LIYLFIFLQTKRARISRETVDTDEESVAAFLEAPAAQSLPPLPNDPLDSDTTVIGDKVRPLFHPFLVSSVKLSFGSDSHHRVAHGSNFRFPQ
jgi:hypothetical protein